MGKFGNARHFVCAAAVFLAWAGGIALGASINLNPPLVGIGCDGANGLIYAMEEDDFPFCDRIERITP